MNAPSSTTQGQELLKIENLCVRFERGDRVIPIVRDATLEVRVGEITCLVGESGSGKSVTSRTIMGLTQMNPKMKVSGSVSFDGTELFSLRPDAMREMRGRDLAMVFQEPLSSLDPVFSVRSQLREALRRRESLSKKAEAARLREVLAEVGIHDGERVLRSNPHQISGGMCQRVMIAMALLAKPRLLIADEPTTALDVTIQAQILELIDRLRREEGMSVLLVTHDMGVAAEMADRVVVMYSGRVVEDGEPTEVFHRPSHPYTQGLLACIPPMMGERPDVLSSIAGNVPDPAALPGGCAFHPRCPQASDDCQTADPPLARVRDTAVACWNPLPAPETRERMANDVQNGQTQ